MKLKQLRISAAIVASVCCLAGCAAIEEQDDIADYRGLSKREVAEYNANPENKDKIVCTIETPVGSNIPRRICRMQSEIKQRSEEDRKYYEDYLRFPDSAQP